MSTHSISTLAILVGPIVPLNVGLIMPEKKLAPFFVIQTLQYGVMVVRVRMLCATVAKDE
jgi:hypothetical protein